MRATECNVCGIYFGHVGMAGYCESCLKEKRTQLKKYFWVSAMIGAIFALSVAAGIAYVKAGVYEDTGYYIIGLTGPGFFDVDGIIHAIHDMTAMTQFVLMAILFLLPFSRYVKLSPDHRSSHGTEVLAELVATALSGPFWAVYNTILYLRIGWWFRHRA